VQDPKIVTMQHVDPFFEEAQGNQSVLLKEKSVTHTSAQQAEANMEQKAGMINDEDTLIKTVINDLEHPHENEYDANLPDES
jgi:hypothetical protein